MASLAALATKCRFAVLEVSDDDEDEEKSGVGDDEAGNSESADANNVTKTKKKRKKKKNKAKNEKNSRNETDDEKQRTGQDDGWNEWMQKDEEFVLSQFQRDLKMALEASKQEQRQTILQQQMALEASKQVQQQKILQQQESVHDTSSVEMSQENTKEKRKKEKPIVMSLDEFQMNVTTEENIASSSAKPEKPNFVTKLDNFFAWQGVSSSDPKEVQGKNVMSPGSLGYDVPQIEEKPAVSGKPEKTSRRKRNSGRSEGDASNAEQVKQAAKPEKKLLPATHEDQIQAEMVHIKDELDKTGHELIELRKAKAEHIQIIEDLKKELLLVKRRNKQLCFILSQAEMKEKSELLMQIEELNEVKDQVVQLHAELEQERSKNSALKSDMAKLTGGKQRHGSSSCKDSDA